MDSDSAIQFAEFDKRLSSTDKRIDDVKWFIGGLATLFTVGFSILTVILSWNYSNDRAWLRSMVDDMKAELGKDTKVPDLILKTQDGKELNGAEIQVTFYKDDKGYYQLSIPHIFANKGLGSTGPMFQKVYTKSPLKLNMPSTDEGEFQYETYFQPKDMQPSELLGLVSTAQWAHFSVGDGLAPPPSGRYLIMFKVFYGKGRVSQATFTAIVGKSA